MGITVPRTIKPRVVSLALIDHLAVEVRQPSLDVPGRYADKNLVIFAWWTDLLRGASGIERGAATGNAFVVAVDHDDQVRLLAALGSQTPEFDREALAHELLGRSSARRRPLDAEIAQLPAECLKELLREGYVLRVLAEQGDPDVRLTVPARAICSESLRPSLPREPQRRARTALDSRTNSTPRRSEVVAESVVEQDDA